MNLQYISDNSGNKTAVVIPIEQWEKIPKKYKNLTFDNDYNLEQQMSQNEFVQWIDDAEKSANMTLEEFNTKWELKKKRIQSLIR